MGPGSPGLKSPTRGVKVKIESWSVSLFEFDSDDKWDYLNVV